MHFKNLSKAEQSWIKDLCKDDVFQDRFGHDEVLDALESEKYNKKDTLQGILSIAGIHQKIRGCKVGILTVLKLAVLWVLKSPVVFPENSEVTSLDIDIFFYILNHSFDGDELEMVKNALGETKRMGVATDEAVLIAKEVLSTAFRPLKMFPATQGQVKKPVFDDDWISSMVSVVHAMTGLKPEEIIHYLPLNAVFLYYIQYCRSNGAKHISKRTPLELAIAIDDRCNELIVDRLIELKKVSESCRDEFLNKIKMPVENK